MPRALISVSDKRGIVPFAEQLVKLGWEIISTGGTATALKNAGVPVIPVDQVTGSPEILDGRVKTLHPKIHGGLLYRRDLAAQVAEAKAHDITAIDLVVVNLYPFRATIARPEVTFEDAIENIDIGGPSMLRSAAKNHEHVLVVIDPADYTPVLERIKAGTADHAYRRGLAAKVFAHTSDYDAAIAGYLSGKATELPPILGLGLQRVQALRYGENPTQRAALYVNGEPRGMADLAQRQGKELSFNNLLDIDAAVMSIAAWPTLPACVIIKHTTPCGLAVGNTAVDAFKKALATDPKSAFGGVVGFNTVVDAEVAKAMAELFVEVVVAPRVQKEALDIFAAKKNLRVVELPVGQEVDALDFKTVRGGFLVQDRFRFDGDESGWKVVTKRAPTDPERFDLSFAWAAVAAVKSNAILIAREGQALGIGAGQMSRVDSSFMAVHKAKEAGHDIQGAALASDAFFPFPDGVEEAAAAGITAIIQPGGSVNDPKVIEGADRLGLAMIFTGKRQFRH